MKYLLDTNVVSSLMKGDPTVLAHLLRVAPEDVLIPQPVIAEITFGIERLAHSKRQEALVTSLQRIKSDIARANWTDEVSATFGAVKATLERRGERIEDFDAAVAAHALAARCVLVTANVKHMSRVAGLTVEDWSRPVEE